MLEIIIAQIMEPLVADRLYWDTTPNQLEQDENGNYKNFIIAQEIADSVPQYVDQTLATKTFARVQLVAVSSNPIERKLLSMRMVNLMVDSPYPVEVYDGSTGGYDDSRQLFSRTSQFGIWFDRPSP